MPVASPCTGICRLDPHTQVCVGCLRSLEEIAAWSRMDDSQRLAVLAVVARRREEGSLRAERDADQPGG